MLLKLVIISPIDCNISIFYTKQVKLAFRKQAIKERGHSKLCTWALFADNEIFFPWDDLPLST